MALASFLASFSRRFSPPYVKPSEEKDDYWIFAVNPTAKREENDRIYGKWLVFKPNSEMDETWREIYDAVTSGDLPAPQAKCSTSKVNPNSDPAGKTKVICVYTSKEDMEMIGLLLIYLVKQTIRYKTDEASRRGLYAHSRQGRASVTTRTLFWNDGKPRISKERKLD
eukprot:m.14321 g.14321  ORF g.14321 m.14321 type:complete len:168 (+) comp25686_c0_seq1:32-535(+)